MCLATNSEGTSSSDTSSLCIVPDGERIEDIQESTTPVSEKHQKHSVSDGSIHEMRQYIMNFIQETEGKEIMNIKQDITATGKQLEENASHFHKLTQQLKAQSNQLLEKIKLQSAQMLSRYKEQEDDNSKRLQTYKKDLEIYETQLNEKVKTCKTALEQGSEKAIHDVGYDIKSPASRPVKPSLITPSVIPEEVKKTLIEKSFEDFPHLARSMSVALQKGREKETIDEPSDVYTLLSEEKTLKQCSIPYGVTSICPTKNGETWMCTADHTLILLDKKGNTKQTIRHTTWISDISLSPTTNMVWICDGNRDILELASRRLVRRFRIREKPLCICSTASNHVIVGTDGRITKYTPEGSQVLTSPATDNDEPIVCCPGKISECVVTHNVPWSALALLGRYVDSFCYS